MGLGRGSAIASFPEGSQLDRLTAHLLGTALPPLQSLTRGRGGFIIIGNRLIFFKCIFFIYIKIFIVDIFFYF